MAEESSELLDIAKYVGVGGSLIPEVRLPSQDMETREKQLEKVNRAQLEEENGGRKDISVSKRGMMEMRSVTALMDQQVSQANKSLLDSPANQFSESEPDQKTGHEIERDLALATSKLGLE